MNTYKKEEILEMAKKADDVEIYQFTEQDRYIRGIHTDVIKGIDIDINSLPDEFTGEVELMGEDEYGRTVLANSSINADFTEWYEDKDATILVVVMSCE